MNEQMCDPAIVDCLTQYRLSEQAEQRKLTAFQTDPQPGDLIRELALCRLLLQRAIDSGNNMLANNLLGTISRISKEYDKMCIRRGELLGKAALMELAQQLIEAVTKHFSGCNGFEDRLAAMADDLQQSITNAKNPEHDERRILHAMGER